MSKKRSRKNNAPELSARAIHVATAFDTLPQVSQDYVVEIMNSLIRIRRDDAPVARLLWARSDPKRVRKHEQQIEDFQSTNRKGRQS